MKLGLKLSVLFSMVGCGVPTGSKIQETGVSQQQTIIFVSGLDHGLLFSKMPNDSESDPLKKSYALDGLTFSCNLRNHNLRLPESICVISGQDTSTRTIAVKTGKNEISFSLAALPAEEFYLSLPVKVVDSVEDEVSVSKKTVDLPGVTIVCKQWTGSGEDIYQCEGQVGYRFPILK